VEQSGSSNWRNRFLTKTQLGCRIRPYLEAMKQFFSRFNPTCARSS
jgi:hypothetical protein